MIEAMYMGMAVGFILGVFATVVGLALWLDHFEKKAKRNQ